MTSTGGVCGRILLWSERKVSVQREPSGHNIKHATKWCPPNK